MGQMRSKVRVVDQEWLVQLAVLVACLKTPSLIQELDPSLFEEELRPIFRALQSSAKSPTKGKSTVPIELDYLLSHMLGVKRKLSQGCWDAILEKLYENAEWRERLKAEPFQARLDKLQHAIRERREKNATKSQAHVQQEGTKEVGDHGEEGGGKEGEDPQEPPPVTTI